MMWRHIDNKGNDPYIIEGSKLASILIVTFLDVSS
jgi:hypothetical protein